MVRKGRLKPGRLVDLIDECNDITQDVRLETDAVRLRFQRAMKFLHKILDLLGVISKDIQEKKIEIAQQRYRFKYKSRSVDQSLNWRRYEIEYLEQVIDERYYKHHGRGTEKHRLVREQEEQIRILRRKVVHGGNNLAAEKKLLNDLKSVEETRAKIIANGLEYIQCRRQSMEDIENQIKVNQIREREYAEKLMYSKMDLCDKNLRMMEYELKKTKEMEVEIINLIQSLNKLIAKNWQSNVDHSK